jgi:hypothetical protein
MGQVKHYVVALAVWVAACGSGSSSASDAPAAPASDPAAPGTAIYLGEGESAFEYVELSPGRYRARKRGCAGDVGCVDEGTFTPDLAAKTFVLRSDETGATLDGRIESSGDSPLISVKPQAADVLIVGCATLVYFAALGIWRSSQYFGRYAPPSAQNPQQNCSSNLP